MSDAANTSDALKGAVAELVKVLEGLGRSDLATRALAAGARLNRPTTVVCVVGEFKQGKSSLVNGLLGRNVCPVDDDLATSAITLIRHGEEPSAIVRRRVDGEQLAERVPVESLGDWVSEVGNPANRKGVERVEIAVPSPVLSQGLVLVDTPGMGGLGAGHAASTLAFLPFADGLILVSDASAELSAPEVDFLAQARDLCPTVLFVQTKTDLYPAWERILDINRGHLQRRGVDIPSVAVSCSVRTEAMARQDRSLNDSSGFPVLVRELSESVVKPAKATAATRSVEDVRGIIGMVRAGLDEERSVLADPSTASAAMAQFEEAKARLEHLRGPASRWNTVVADRTADLSNEITYRLRGATRTILRDMDERVETLKSGGQWDEMTRDLQTQVADEVTRLFAAVEEGRLDIRREVAELLEQEHLALGGGRSPMTATDVESLWQAKSIDEEGSRAGRAFKVGVTGIRGAQGGVYMFGMLGRFLPATAGALLASNPVLLGAGAVFGGMQLMDDRKRKLAARRQSARTQIRQFIDDVQFEIGNELSGLLREVQRELRDDFGQRLSELQRTYTEAAQRAQQELGKSAEERKARIAQIDAQIAALRKLEGAVGKVTV